MEIIKTEDLSFKYSSSYYNSLRGINLSIKEGEFILLCGKSGCGKTTLLRLLKPLISPYGEKEGKILYFGEPIESLSQKRQAAEIGFVMQNPDSQIVTDKVWHELAFGLESMGLENEVIKRRVGEMAAYFGIQSWLHKRTDELSGGQKQLLNLASVMAMNPKILLLDEPTGQLDPLMAEEFLNAVYKINRELGTTVIISEHRVENLFDKADRIVILEDGELTASSCPKNMAHTLREKKSSALLLMPSYVRIFSLADGEGECPQNIAEGKAWLKKEIEKRELLPLRIKEEETVKNKALEIKDLCARYEKNGENIINNLSIDIYENEILSIVGSNGAGKTTFLSVLSGILPKISGKIKLKDNKKIITLPQNPEMLFVKKTVRLDLEDVLEGKDKGIRDKKIEETAKLLEITELLESHPYDLSGGEKQRAALAKVLLCEGDILLLDEPTKGLDLSFKRKLADILLSLKKRGMTIVMVTHDIEFSAEYSDRVALFFDGALTGISAPRKFYMGNTFYTTSVSKMARDVIDGAILTKDLLYAFGVKENKEEENEKKNKPLKSEIKKAHKSKEKKNISKRTWMMLLILAVMIPLTIYLGVTFLGDRKYYFISLLIMLETFIPFMMIYEGRKPQAREITVIAVLCALAVGGRAVFFMAQQFKPVIAIIIIAGVCFGGETGFLVGSVTAFASNIFSGQGPWTQWQMFALGIIGFMAGILSKKGILKKKKIPLCIFGALATLIIYGGIMNPASVIMWNDNPTLEMIFSAYTLGVPYDLVHAFATVFFLWFIAEPMIEKLERIKKKYGILEI